MGSRTFILGAGGRIGTALCRYMTRSGVQYYSVKRHDYTGWTTSEKAIYGLEKLGLTEGDTLICAAGIINPGADSALIELVNFTLTKNACLAAELLGAKAISLGTILEKLIEPRSQNPYIQSKTRLAEIAENNWLHLQLHTIYGGGLPTGFMFAGLIFNSLQKNSHFAMTAGQQLREYHHIDDEMSAIFTIAKTIDKGCFDITEGHPIKLCDLATGIFKHFDRLDLLGIGEISSPPTETYSPALKRQPLLKDVIFRDVFPAITEWLETCLTSVTPERTGQQKNLKENDNYE